MLFWLLRLVSYMLYFDERNVCSSSVGGWNIEWRCKNSLWSVCKVQAQIVPECSMLVLYWLLRNRHFFATLSSEIAWTWRQQCKVLKVGVKNDIFALCVCVCVCVCARARARARACVRARVCVWERERERYIHCSPLFPDLADLDSVSPKLWDEAARWSDVTVTCMVLSVLSLNFLCMSQSVVGRCISGKENLRRHTPTSLRLSKTMMSQEVHVVQRAWNTLC